MQTIAFNITYLSSKAASQDCGCIRWSMWMWHRHFSHSKTEAKRIEQACPSRSERRRTKTSRASHFSTRSINTKSASNRAFRHSPHSTSAASHRQRSKISSPEFFDGREIEQREIEYPRDRLSPRKSNAPCSICDGHTAEYGHYHLSTIIHHFILISSVAPLRLPSPIWPPPRECLGSATSIIPQP
ncbi:hypothetical protein M413DRAFT_259470 [Hebeloma cylindrosporum]|uniref:Uncharacterized protein n=1 Tax=Hebeloma cylindrosporum TaxID=76867 RepID=A0A0C3CCX8_HEBCY|nr:hypothetical protein M413DRAFT_259470 [Hebeloma cylindrosporum h7]